MKNHAKYAKLLFAQKALNECEQYLSLYRIGNKENNKRTRAFERAISKAFVITYAKPFLRSNKGTDQGYGNGGISTKWLSLCNSEVKSTHHQIVKYSRHLWVAHTDLASLEPEIKLSGAFCSVVTSSQEYFLNEFGYSNLRFLINSCHNSISESMKELRDIIGDCEFKL